MALIKCPECGKEFSDKAPACPMCACPTEYILTEAQKSDAEITTETVIQTAATEPKKKGVPRQTDDKTKVKEAFVDAITQTMWIKGLITTEERNAIAERSKEKLSQT